MSARGQFLLPLRSVTNLPYRYLVAAAVHSDCVLLLYSQRMNRWAGKTAIVTGASSGIGAASAVALANAGLRVLGVARRPDLVEKLQAKVTGKGSISARSCDVSKSEQVQQTFRWVEDHMGGVDVVVNNAALFFHGHITEAGTSPLTEEQIVSELDVNIKGVILCTRHAVASMKKRGSKGHIVNINSLAGHYVPFADIFNVYPSTKYAVTAFTQRLSEELAQFNTGIKTTSISPGLTATNMVAATPEGKEAIKNVPALQPEDVAAAVVYALSTPPEVNISELTIQPVGEKRL